ncbi:hypothetical protein [Roseobacter weihaiensis]|uniref:hypothetical protein n=1 Tax=Roseobacter weihaiensis TaxID=2763262 RepID=UPI001D0B1F57|nr:hypothetical protein [Roseobacter sp. H9]
MPRAHEVLIIVTSLVIWPFLWSRARFRCPHIPCGAFGAGFAVRVVFELGGWHPRFRFVRQARPLALSGFEAAFRSGYPVAARAAGVGAADHAVASGLAAAVSARVQAAVVPGLALERVLVRGPAPGMRAQWLQ